MTTPLIAITGAAQGVGRATAVQLAARGYRLVLLDIQPIDNAPSGAFCYRLDITNYPMVSDTVEMIVGQHGIPDVWVNNAGVGSWQAFDVAQPDAERREMDVNYHGSVNCIRAILPYWRERTQGHLIQITSSSALFPAPHMTGYAASKAAIRAFVQGLRIELRGTGIAITEIVPNTIDTAMSSGANRRAIPKIASIRPDLTPDDVATAVHHAIQKRPREVHLPWLVTPFYWLNTFAPWLIDRLVGWKK